MKQPKVFIAIPTGPSKEYAVHYMVAALKNLDWKNKEIHWSVSHLQDKVSDKFVKRLATLMETVDWNCKWQIHQTYLTRKEDLKSYVPVVKNKQLLRQKFFDSDCSYFLMLGGDCVPSRDTIKRLMKCKADVASGLMYQRPKKEGMVYPLVWLYLWTMKDLERFHLEPVLLKEFEKFWLFSTVTLPLYVVPNWEKRKYIRNFTGGDGCCLIRREVLERVGWYLNDKALHSEDLHFFNNVNLRGFTTVLDVQAHIAHFDEEGKGF